MGGGSETKEGNRGGRGALVKIAFLLPTPSRSPVGGFKVVYEYANRLAERGHDLSVVHPWSCAPPLMLTLKERVRGRLWLAQMRRRRDLVVPWFKIDPQVELPVVDYPRPESLPDADATIATAWQTASCVAGATASTTAGFQLVQGFEPRDSIEEMRGTWHLPLHKIVVSHWLEELAISLGEGRRTSLVRSGFDTRWLGVDRSPAERAPRVGSLLSPYKQRDDVIAALTMAQARVPGLSAVTFGIGERPDDLPGWIEYERLPSQADLRRLYNSCSIFLQATQNEGWGLAATEAMACGCALVTYENGGSREYAFDRRTALVVARHRPEGLGAAIAELATDPELRLELVERGRQTVESFPWSRAVDEFERVLQRVLQAGGSLA